MDYTINRVVVIGAGTMGAAIAAHLANAGIPAYLLDIIPRELTPKEEKKGLTLDHPAVRNRIVNEGWQRCVKARPASLFAKDIAERVTLGNLEDNFDWVGEVDWIVEAIVERLDIKQQLMARIEKTRKPGSIVSTNTSGIPIKDIAEGRSDDFQAHFLGTHFFNPPRYLKLLEVIPHEQTKPEVLEFMKEFGARTLGKGVVICKDTPNFIANRFISLVGTFTLNYALDNGYTVEEVDTLTGPTIGHPKTATFRLYDLIGNTNLYPAIAHDPYREELRHEKSTTLVEAMLEHKWLGNKTRQGFYKQIKTEEGRQFWVLDPETMEYQPPAKPHFESVGKHKDVEDVGERIKRLCAEDDRGGQFLWATIAFGLNYAAHVASKIADDILSIDNANKWGFNHELGPFEIWDALGVAESVERMEAGGLSVAPWVKEMLDAWPPAAQGTTFGGNPVACRAGLATLRVIKEENLMARAVEVGNYIQGRFRKAQKELPIIGDVRGKGLMVAVELINADGSPAGEIIKAVIKEMGGSGIALTKCGASALRFAPPLITTQEQASEGVDMIIQVLRRHQW